MKSNNNVASTFSPSLVSIPTAARSVSNTYTRTQTSKAIKNGPTEAYFNIKVRNGLVKDYYFIDVIDPIKATYRLSVRGSKLSREMSTDIRNANQ